MEKVHTFVSDNGIFKVTIKTDFLKLVPNPEKVEFEKLMTDHEMSKYLHNPHGPAMQVLRNGYEEYWLDGKKCSAEVEAKLKHNIKFADDLETIIDQ